MAYKHTGKHRIGVPLETYASHSHTHVGDERRRQQLYHHLLTNLLTKSLTLLFVLLFAMPSVSLFRLSVFDIFTL